MEENGKHEMIPFRAIARPTPTGEMCVSEENVQQPKKGLDRVKSTLFTNPYTHCRINVC